MTQRRRALTKDEFQATKGNWTDSHWRKAFDQSSVPTAIVSTERRPLRVNKAYSRLTGYTSDELTNLMTFIDITHPDDVARENKLFGELLAGTRETFDREKRYLHADGHVVPVRVFTGAIRDETGALVSLLAQAIDLTEQKRAEAHQDHVKRLTQFAFDQSPIATAIISTDRAPIWVNDAYVRLLGYSRKKLLRLKWLAEVTHPEDLGLDDELFGELLAGTRESFEHEKRYLHADGHVVPVRLFVTGIHDESGALVSLLAQAIDLTPERKAQEERRHATRFAHVLFEQSAVPAGAIGLDGTIVTANDTLVGLSGHSREQLIGSPFTNFVDPDDVHDLAERFAEFYEGIHEVDDFEIRLLHGTGRSVPTRMYTSAFRDDSEALVGFVGQIIDLTEQKRAEEQRETEARLRQILLDKSPIPVGAIDLQSRLQSVNDAFASSPRLPARNWSDRPSRTSSTPTTLPPKRRACPSFSRGPERATNTRSACATPTAISSPARSTPRRYTTTRGRSSVSSGSSSTSRSRSRPRNNVKQRRAYAGSYSTRVPSQQLPPTCKVASYFLTTRPFASLVTRARS